MKTMTPTLLMSLLAVACGTAEEPQTAEISMAGRVQHFEDARLQLEQITTVHLDEMMLGERLNLLMEEELEWSMMARESYQDMETWILSTRECTNADGAIPDTADAIQALNELNLELRAHQLGMLTMVDFQTALAAERAFQQRLVPLQEELQAHAAVLRAVADCFTCPL